MSKTEKELETQKVIEAAVLSVLRFNEKQEYFDDDRTYAEHFIKNKSNILRSAGVKEVNEYEIDRLLAMREMEDNIKQNNPDLQRLIEKDIAYITDENEYPAIRVNHPDIEDSLIFSWEPKEDPTSGLVGEGAIIYNWGDDEGLRHHTLAQGLKAAEEGIISKLYDIAELKEFEGELDKNEAYRNHIENGDINVKSVKITAAEFSKFPGGINEDNHVSGIIKYQIEGRDFESKFKQNISGGEHFSETVYDNKNMLRVFLPEGKTQLLDLETGEKHKDQVFYLSKEKKEALKESINNTLKKAAPVITANYNKPNQKLVDEVNAKDGKHYSFKPETLDALARFGDTVDKVENKKRNKLKI